MEIEFVSNLKNFKLVFLLKFEFSLLYIMQAVKRDRNISLKIIFKFKKIRLCAKTVNFYF